MCGRPRFRLIYVFSLGHVQVQEQEEQSTYGLLKFFEEFVGMRFLAPVTVPLHGRERLQDRPKAMAPGRRHVE